MSQNKNIDILRNAFRVEKNLQIIKKEEYDIYYSCTVKYPLVVVEKINKQTGFNNINLIKNKNKTKYPIKEDVEIDEENRLKIEDYINYMEYGGSCGHNASSANHKTNIDRYLDTFLLSNHSPQEIVLNTGLWSLLEHWCMNLKNNDELTNIVIYTGNIIGENMNFNDSTINIPNYMFKIVTAIDKNNPQIMYIASFLIPNKRPTEKIFKLFTYLSTLKDIIEMSNINLFQLFSCYSGYKSDYTELQTIKRKERIDVHLTNNIKLINQMKSSYYYGILIYSKSIEELEYNWNNCKLNSFGDELHKKYYELCKKRIMSIKCENDNIVINNKLNKLLYNKKKSVKKPKNNYKTKSIRRRTFGEKEI